MAVFISNDDVRKLLPMAECIDVLEDLFRQEADGLVENIPRRRYRFGGPRAATLMGGVALGSKAYGVRHGSLSLLHDTDTGRLEALIEPSTVAWLRTGAASGVATKHMALADASVVGLIGTGRQAVTQLEAVCAVRSVKRVKAFSRTPEKREQFAREMSEALGIDVEPVASAEESVRGSQIVVAITNSRTPVIDGQWLEPGTHVNAAGANSWTRCEIDETTITRAARVVVDNLEQAKGECGELIAAVERGAFRWRDAVELHQVVGGVVMGRPSSDSVTLFESQGIGTEDVACYAYVLRKAREWGLGAELPF